MRNLLLKFLFLFLVLCFSSTLASAAAPKVPVGFERIAVGSSSSGGSSSGGSSSGGGSSSDDSPVLSSGVASSLSQYGVTWKFSKSVKYGQFVTGDYWIVDPGGGVKVTISPAPGGGRNGSQVNPTTDHQPFDSRAGYYSAALLFQSGGTIKAGDSLISTVSEVAAGDDEDVLGRRVADAHSFVQSAAALTVLGSAAPANSFRPPIFGTAKPIYSYNKVNMSKLANLAHSTLKPSHIANSSKSVVQNYANYLRRPWIIWGHDYLGRFIHPLDNMPNYYEYCYYVYSEGGLIINSDYSGKAEVVKGLVQLGIDTYYVTAKNKGDRTVSKFPMLVAGVLLGEPKLYTSSYSRFKEILQTYYGTGWSKPTPTVLWRQKTVNAHEQADPSHWHSMYVAEQGESGAGKLEKYRRCCSSNSWSGIALSIRAMNASTQWNHKAFLDYVDRWHNEAGAVDSTNRAKINSSGYSSSAWGNSGDTESKFTSDMWSKFRKKF